MTTQEQKVALKLMGKLKCEHCFHWETKRVPAGYDGYCALFSYSPKERKGCLKFHLKKTKEKSG